MRTTGSRVPMAVAVGGVVGAEIRYLLGVAFPAAPGGWPWTTFWINVSGCLLIGVLYTVLAGADRPNPLLRPLLGVGVLGGFTTFSAWSVETVQLAGHGHYGLALGYALASPVVAVAACALAVALTRRIGGARWTR
ncbi:fluoride efflux transporter CrcB [Pseudonocardia kongjuensis]|uniref:Fluoride-specific ion channel FluC n=1 Tax=Pseudonocardia kongjuensis TaxID=102227 RepID=A0ABN1Y0U6_9PSEU